MIDLILPALVSGLILGSLYALMASGLSLVWITLGVFNFAHGTILMISATMAWTAYELMGLPLLLAMLVGILFAGVIGLLVEIIMIRPFYGNPGMMLITVMTTLSAMIIIEKGSQMIWGARLKQLPRLIEGEIGILGTVVSRQEALIVVIAPITLLALWGFAKHTYIGRSLRAVGQNQDSAALLGIDVKRAFLITFGLAAILAGLCGVLLGSIRFITPTMGADPLVKAMIVVIFGGLGSLGATAGAAYVIGFLEALLIVFVGLYWTPFFLFVIMILTLVFRRNGLFGKSET